MSQEIPDQKIQKSKRGRMSLLSITSAFVGLIAVLIVLAPQVFIYPMLLVDFLTPWVAFESPLYDMYHTYLVSRLKEREELPIPEIRPEDVTNEMLVRLSKGYTFPVVIKGMLKNNSAMVEWTKRDFWMKNYGDEELLCGTLANVREECNVKTFF